MRQIHRFLALSRSKKKLLLYAFVLLNGIRLALWMFPFGLVKRQLAAVSTAWVCPAAKPPIALALIVKAVAIAGRHTPGKARCLVRALTTQALLNHYRYPHQLHIGVMKKADCSVEAHAWIEYEGLVIVGGLDNLSEFKPLSAAGLSQ